jgi:hypothetical protein
LGATRLPVWDIELEEMSPEWFSFLRKLNIHAQAWRGSQWSLSIRVKGL